MLYQEWPPTPFPPKKKNGNLKKEVQKNLINNER